MKTRDETWKLLTEYTTSESLIKHGLAVEAAMIWYAKDLSLSPDEVTKWGITGLIHDFDYERWPEPISPDGHPYIGERILAERGYDPEIREAIMGHATYSGVPRVSKLSKTLFAVDELTGLITASVLVRPDRSIKNLEVKSVLKKMKDKGFAKGCNREDIRIGAEELGVALDQHIKNVIDGMTAASTQLGL